MAITIDVENIAPRLKIKTVGEVQKIYDPIRNRYFVLTPEVFIRQIFLSHLIEVMKYPKALIQVEKVFLVNELRRRFDILIFDKIGNALMLIECKSATTVLNNSVLDQTVNYNLSLKVPYLVITNGLSTFAFKIDLLELPDWQNLSG